MQSFQLIRKSRRFFPPVDGVAASEKVDATGESALQQKSEKKKNVTKEDHEDWEEVEGGESADNGVGATAATGTSNKDVATAHEPVEVAAILPDVPTTEPSNNDEDEPSPKKQKHS